MVLRRPMHSSTGGYVKQGIEEDVCGMAVRNGLRKSSQPLQRFFTNLLLLFCHLSYFWTGPSISPDWLTQPLSPALRSVIPDQEKLPEWGVVALQADEMDHITWMLPTSFRSREDRHLTLPVSIAAWRQVPKSSSWTSDRVTGTPVCRPVLGS